MNHLNDHFLRRLWLLIIVLFVCGCAEDKVVFHEVKHPHERLKTSELNVYLQIIKSLPDKKAPALSPLYAPVPDWDYSRELSVKGLIKEEQKYLPNRWFAELEVAKVGNNPRLIKAIKRNNLSVEQFLGLTETISLAAARTHYEDPSELRSIIRAGLYEVKELNKIDKVFAKFPEEEKFDLIRRSAWLCRLTRAQSLLEVPEENAALLKKHWAVITPYLPEDALRDPLADIVDSLLDFGLPFEELPKTGSDITLKWSPRDEGIHIGRDK